MNVILWVLWLVAHIPALATPHIDPKPQSTTPADPTQALAAPQPSPQSRYKGETAFMVGKATYYDAGLMEAVARKRGLSLDGASGWATYPDCSEIGSFIMVSVLNPKTGKYSEWSLKRIADCSEPRDYMRHKVEGLVELSYLEALDYGYLSDGHTTIRYYLSDSKRGKK